MIVNSGLSSSEVQARLKQYGPNSLPLKKKHFFIKIIKWVISPVSLMLLAAAGLSYAVGKMPDVWIILFLFVSNFIISAWHEGKVDKSIEKLQEHLVVEIPVMRDGKWKKIGSVEIVPGDIIELKIGSVIPADIKIIEAKNLSINESVLTGESLPKMKEISDTAYSGSFVATGYAVGRVTKTGGNTYFGKTVADIDQTPRKSSLEKDILSISKYLSIISVAVVVLLTIVLWSADTPITDIATLDLSLLIAGIPVALPTVMSLIISIGVLQLSKKKAIVRRLSSLEDLANVDLLLSDKTGTLTQNKIHVEKIVSFGKNDTQAVIALAVSALEPHSNGNALEHSVVEKALAMGVKAYKQIDFIPGDSERKRSTATITLNDKDRSVVSLGATQVIEELSVVSAHDKKIFDDAVKEAAEGGFRVLAVALRRGSEEEKNMELIGLLYLADRLHADAPDTIRFMNEHGIDVKMVTGDSYEISERIAAQLGLKGSVCRRTLLDGDDPEFKKQFKSISVFSEVLPKDKYTIVNFAREHHVVAVTGDGINDLPAVKAGDVGFAVSNAVDALKSSADIVLFSSGISVIKDAIIEARKIYMRLYDYTLYRISESFRVIITIAVIGVLLKAYPLTPIQLIVLALLNDIPIVSLAFDRVKSTAKPEKVSAKQRFTLGSLFGITGVAESLILLYIMMEVLHLPWDVIQTMFFLKLVVSGHLLVYVAHTRERWFKFLPSKQVIVATGVTQIAATLFAFFGVFTAPISLSMIVLVWIWALLWMQVSELAKDVSRKIFGTESLYKQVDIKYKQ